MCLQGLMKFHHCLLKILRKNQNVADRRNHGWTDRRENSIPPPSQTQFAGGIKKQGSKQR